MVEFVPVTNAAPSVGLVLRTGDPGGYLRITHIFEQCVFAMWVGVPALARTARRPFRISNTELDSLSTAPAASWGRIVLPARFSSPPVGGSAEESVLDSKWKLIFPLIQDLDREKNLDRTRYEAVIRQRAEDTGTPFGTLKRLIHRYFYFGRSTYALNELPRGTKPGAAGYSKSSAKRRGRASVLANDLGANDFVVSEADVEDMVAELKSCLRQGPTTRPKAHVEYMAKRFSKRHPVLYEQYIAGARQLPVTLRQFKYHITKNAELDDKLSANLRTHNRSSGSLGSVYASGPGEVYEIDATQGRLYLVNAGTSPAKVQKPTIYLMIDRWSRFVVSAYMSLQPASYEEVRQCLLIAFTSRERRFRALGVNIDDARWPVGPVPTVLCHDRGSEFISNSMRQAAAKDLRIELTPLPPYCPDGKAIVERMMRELKRRMAETGMKGVYADRPLDPKTKKVAKTAKAAAVHSLAEAYRVLIELINEHNSRPHRALRRKKVLTQAGIEPTPKAAFLWGLKNITGMRVAPFTDDEYRRMLLATDTASIGSGVLRYRGRPYLPADEVALDIAQRSSKRASQIQIRIDKHEPYEVFIVTQQGAWATFQMTRGGEAEISNLTLQEEEAFAAQNALLWARSEHKSQLSHISALNTKARQRGRPAAKSARTPEQLKAHADEAPSLQVNLTGAPPSKLGSERKADKPEWMRLEEEERQRSLDLVRKQRKKN